MPALARTPRTRSGGALGRRLMAIVVLGLSGSIGMVGPIGFDALQASAAELTSAEVLARLRAKDQQFDNARLEILIFEQWNNKPVPAWKLKAEGNKNAVALAAEPLRPSEIRSIARETLVVRGRDVTVIHQVEPNPTDKAADQPVRTAFRKASSTDGIWRQFWRTAASGPDDATLEIRPGMPVDLNQEHAMFVEFCLGFGFGKRIRTIDRIERADGLLKVEGSIQIWWEDESTFQLTLDDHDLVRDATIEANVKGNRTRFVVHTRETATTAGLELAQRGSFKRYALGVEKPGQPSRPPSLKQEFKILFKAVQPDLSDADYQQLIAIPREPGTEINDYVKGETYLVGQPPLRLLPATKNP